MGPMINKKRGEGYTDTTSYSKSTLTWMCAKLMLTATHLLEDGKIYLKSSVIRAIESSDDLVATSHWH